MNVWSFTARLGADAETKKVGDGTVTEFRVAVSSGWGDREETTWVRCNYWGRRGEAVAPYLTKGQLIAASGELTNREYTTKDGGKGYSLEVRVSELTLVGGRRTETPPAPSLEQKAEALLNDDIPF